MSLIFAQTGTMSVPRDHPAALLKCCFFLRWKGAKPRQVLIFSYTPFCISLPLVWGRWAVYDFKTGTGGSSILAAGKSVFTLIYQTRRLASYYLDYSLTSSVQLSVTGVFTTCLVPRGVRDGRVGMSTNNVLSHKSFDCICDIWMDLLVVPQHVSLSVLYWMFKYLEYLHIYLNVLEM